MWRASPARRHIRRAAFALLATCLGVVGLVGPPASAQVQADGGVCSPPPTGSSPAQVSGGLHAVDPVRMLDTRSTTGPLGAGCTIAVDMLQVAPAQATGLALDVVAVDSSGAGFVTVYPCDTQRPLASNLNTRSDTTPNAAVVPLLPSRRICFYTSVATNLVVDVMGWFGPGGAPFHGATPARLLDTRSGPRPDGGEGPVPGATAIVIPVAGIDPVPAGATAVSVNLTVTETQNAGFLTVYPCGQLPATSNGNYLVSDTRATHAIVGLSGAGELCVFASQTTHLIVDLAGWYGGATGDRLTPIVGTRVLDSRDGTGGWSTPIGAGEVRAFDPTKLGTVPVGATAVLDVVATNANVYSYLTLFPCGGSLPATSSVNYVPGVDIMNLVVVPLGTSGLVCVFSSGITDVVVDVAGSLGAAGPLLGLQVSGSDLVPPFSPDASDYGVICGAGANGWHVTTNAVFGASVAISGADQSGNLSVNENGLVTITATLADASSRQYFVRCLPHDFPPLTVQQSDDNAPGWYLTGTWTATPGLTNYAVILDERGAVLWYHKTGAPVIDVKHLPDNNLVWTPLLGGGFGVMQNGVYEERGLDGNLVHSWKTSCAGQDAVLTHCPTDHHDIQPVPGTSDMMMITYHLRTGVNLTSLGQGFGASENVVDAWIQQIAPDGSVVWWWHSEDHLGLSEPRAQIDGLNIRSTIPNPDGPGTISVVDLVHINSLDIEPTSGDIVFSGRHLDAVYRIRRNPGQPDDGKVLWKLGGSAPVAPGALHFNILNDPLNGTYRQHDARLLPNGHITIYDNESGRSSDSRAVEYALDVGAGTATLVWQYANSAAPPSGQAFGLGSAWRSADGSTAIGWGPIVPILTEVGPTGSPSLTVMYAGYVGNTYRVAKEPAATFNRATLRAVPPS